MDGLLLEGQKGSGMPLQYNSQNAPNTYLQRKLFARRGKLDDNSRLPWTSFEMVLREPSPIPPAFDFARFLASSITFMIYLEEVSVYFNDWCLVKINKSIGPPQLHQLPRNLSRTSPNSYMTVSGLRVTRMSNIDYVGAFR